MPQGTFHCKYHAEKTPTIKQTPLSEPSATVGRKNSFNMKEPLAEPGRGSHLKQTVGVDGRKTSEAEINNNNNIWNWKFWFNSSSSICMDKVRGEIQQWVSKVICIIHEHIHTLMHHEIPSGLAPALYQPGDLFPKTTLFYIFLEKHKGVRGDSRLLHLLNLLNTLTFRSFRHFRQSCIASPLYLHLLRIVQGFSSSLLYVWFILLHDHDCLNQLWQDAVTISQWDMWSMMLLLISQTTKNISVLHIFCSKTLLFIPNCLTLTKRRD